jgi:hypothetical protein
VSVATQAQDFTYFFRTCGPARARARIRDSFAAACNLYIYNLSSAALVESLVYDAIVSLEIFVDQRLGHKVKLSLQLGVLILELGDAFTQWRSLRLEHA